MKSITKAFCVGLASTFLFACGSSESVPSNLTAAGGNQESETFSWEAPPDYEFRLASRCGERNLIGRFYIFVKDHRVSEVRGLDEAGRNLVRSEWSSDILTLQELLDEAKKAQADNAEVVQVTYDEKDGYPTQIDIDHDVETMDDEACFEIDHYKELAA